MQQELLNATYRTRRHTSWSWGARWLAAVLAAAVAGCGPATLDLMQYAPSTDGPPQVFDDRDWATVLRENVREGLVDYGHLAEHSEPLTNYLLMISRVGPQSAPELFTERGAVIAYYINAYNAAVLMAVLREKAPPTMYEVGRRSPEHRYRLRVDGRQVTPCDLREAARTAASEDARVEFALCGGALGCPPLMNQPFRPGTLGEDLDRLAREAMGLEQLVRIDHEQQRLLVGLPIADRRAEFLEYHRRAHGATNPTLLGSLLSLADGARRDWLNTAVGYKEGVISFDRKLNRWTAE